MPKKARKPKADKGYPLANIAPSTKTPQEIMRGLDAENMVKLLHELVSTMPAIFREKLKERGFLQFKVADFDIQITTKGRFESNDVTYGKVAWW